MAPSATLADASGDRAVVRIGYDVIGPGIEVAETSAGLVAKDHCATLGKSYELVWSKREARDRRRGEYVFFYACERQEERLRDRKAIDSTPDKDIRTCPADDRNIPRRGTPAPSMTTPFPGRLRSCATVRRLVGATLVVARRALAVRSRPAGDNMGATYVDVTIRNPAQPERTWTGPFLVDTGAFDSLVPRTHLEAIGLTPRSHREYTLADGRTLSLDITVAEIEFEGERVGGTVVYGDEGAEPLLGVTALESGGFEVDPREERLKRLPAVLLKRLR